jgi:pilus assembly protein CpaC
LIAFDHDFEKRRRNAWMAFTGSVQGNTRMFTRFFMPIPSCSCASSLVCSTGKQAVFPTRGARRPNGSRLARRFALPALCGALLALAPAALFGQAPLIKTQAANAESPSTANLLIPPSVFFKVENPEDKLEMIVGTSRILMTKLKIQQQQVDKSDIVEITPLSPNQIQIAAKAVGIVRVNLWDENKKIYTIDIRVVGDARNLAATLQAAFPSAALKVTPVANAVMIEGFVDRPEQIDRIIRVAEEYYPKVINNMSVGGSQQVLLHVKVMEVSRTKLRELGIDWAKITGTNTVVSGPSGLLTDYTSSVGSGGGVYRSASPSTFAFNVGDSANSFLMVMNALREDNLMKIMSEPTLVTVNGQRSTFNVGGQMPVPEPQSLGTISISWKNYGTQIDFIPIVLGNGKIRLQVHPTISSLDSTTAVTISGTTVKGLKSRDVQTSVEMEAGQTLAIAGLVESTIQASTSGLPWISEVPILGVLFRQELEQRNEVELLIMVTPEFAEGLNADQVPKCGPGQNTTTPSDWELFMNGHLEVPACCPDGDARVANQDNCVKKSSGTSQNNQQQRNNPNAAVASNANDQQKGPPEFVGPVGYEVVK